MRLSVCSRWFALGALLLGPSRASAQPAPPPTRDPAAAEVLFHKGLEYLKVDDWKNACPQFNASMRLDPSVGTQVNIARCADHDGLLARAWAEFKKAKVLNQETPGARRDQLDSFIDSEIARLEPRIPWITVRVSPRPAGLIVERDGASVPIEGLDQRVPIEPGEHTVSAAAPGHRRATQKITIAEGQQKEVVLALVVDPGAVVEPPVPKLPPPRDGGHEGEQGPSVLLIVGGVLSGVGALSLATAAITGGLAYSARGTLDDLVASGQCTESPSGDQISCSSQARAESHDAIARGEPLALASTVTLFAGAAIAATGLTLIIVGVTQSKSSEAVREAAIVPLILPGGGGVAIGGLF